jgi:hypothetical protein
MDRFERYSIYLMSWGRGSAPASPVCPPDPAFADAALASGIGVYQHTHGAQLLSIDGFDRCVANLSTDATESARDDIGLTDRDEREQAEARARLQGLILAGGQTDTGGRWLFDAAADEIVRLRFHIDVLNKEQAHDEKIDARRRAELRQAKEALEQARAKVDELRGVVSVQNRMLNAAPPAATGLTGDERAALERLGYVEHAGGWQHMWVGPAYDPAKPEDLAELRRDMAGHRELDKTELSAEDAETLRASGAWRTSEDGLVWVGPAGGVVDPRTSFGLRGMREAAAELRTKAPPVAHGEPGKVTGGDHAAGGKSSLAEGQGAAQDTSPAPGQGAVPHGGDRGQALPKPTRVEVGQRWRHLHDGLDRVVEQLTEESAYLSKAAGRPAMLTSQEGMLESPLWTFLGGPSPQDPSPKRGPCDSGSHVDFEPCDLCPDGAPAAAESTDGPTARDAVAGMLLRYGFDGMAWDVCRGTEPREIVAAMGRGPALDARVPKAAPCISALDALARGAVEVHIFERRTRFQAIRIALAALDGETLEHAARRVIRERDEAREEVDRWIGRAADLEKQRDEACKDALDAMREARTLRYRVAELETIAASFICGKCGTFPSEGEPQPSGMRIERRVEGEWLIGATDESDGCGITDPNGRFMCSRHFDGEHMATGIDRGDGRRVFARWPIASPARLVEPASGGTSHPEALTSADGRVTLIIRDGVDADDVFKACAELLDMPSESAELVRVAGLASDLSFASGVEEGSHRAKAKAAELATSWETRRQDTLRLRASVKHGSTTWARRDSSALIRQSCILELSDAFDIPLPATPPGPGKPPTGEPVPDASGVVPPSGTTDLATSAVVHGGVTVTAPDGMTLSEVWAALTSSPALRVCLDSELRAARESARGTTPADLETARRDIRAAVLEDAFRAGAEEGQRRARLFPVTPGPLAELAGRIEEIIGDAYGRATWARHVAVRVLGAVDSHLQSASTTRRAPTSASSAGSRGT